MAPTQDVVGHTVCMGMHVFMLEHSVYWPGQVRLLDMLKGPVGAELVTSKMDTLRMFIYSCLASCLVRCFFAESAVRLADW